MQEKPKQARLEQIISKLEDLVKYMEELVFGESKESGEELNIRVAELEKSQNIIGISDLSVADRIARLSKSIISDKKIEKK